MIPEIERLTSQAILRSLGWEDEKSAIFGIYQPGVEDERPWFLRLINGYLTSDIANDSGEVRIVWETWLGATLLWDALWLSEGMYDPDYIKKRHPNESVDYNADTIKHLEKQKTIAEARIADYCLVNDPDYMMELFYANHSMQTYRRYLRVMVEGWTCSTSADHDPAGCVWRAAERLQAIVEIAYLRRGWYQYTTGRRGRKGTLPVLTVPPYLKDQG